MEYIILIILLILVITLLAHINNENKKLNRWYMLEQYIKETERIRRENNNN